MPSIILGAGLSGLAAAAELPGSVVYEAKDHPGGHAWSHEQHGVHYDEGAHICHAKDEAWLNRLFANAGRVVTVPQSRVANYWHGHWTTYPVQNHLRELPPDLRIRALTDLVAAQLEHQGKTPSHYADWVRFHYGDFLAEQFYREYTDKYWRTPMEQMDTDWLSGRLLPAQLQRILHGAIAPLDERQSVFSSFHYPERGGFFSFFKPMIEGLDIRTGARLVELDPVRKEVRFADGRTAAYARLISTIPLPDLVNAVRGAPDEIRQLARELRHTQLLVVNLLVRKPHLVPHHWFYIYDAAIDVARVKVMSNVTPAGCPPGRTALQCEIFRRDDEPMARAALVRKAVSDLGALLGFDPQTELDAVDEIFVSHAYPIPLLGRAAVVQRITDWLDSIGIVTAGLYGRWKYLWSNEAYAAGVTAARALRAR